MKAWIGSQDLMREHRSWVFWDGEWRHAWRPAVALTAGTTVHGDRRPGAQKDAVTRVGRHPVPEPMCSAFPVSSVLRIFYIHFPITQRSIRFQSRFIRACLGGLFSFIATWTLQKIGEELSPHIFLNNCAKARPVWCALIQLVRGLWPAWPTFLSLGFIRQKGEGWLYSVTEMCAPYTTPLHSGMSIMTAICALNLDLSLTDDTDLKISSRCEHSRPALGLHHIEGFWSVPVFTEFFFAIFKKVHIDFNHIQTILCFVLQEDTLHCKQD